MTAAATLSSTATFRAKALARENLDMVDTCLRITRARFHDLPSDDTLRGVGTEALWRAARRYDASKGASFSTYASRRVIGSMRDTRRRTCHVDYERGS